MKFKTHTHWITILAILALALVACQNATPTVETHQTPIETERVPIIPSVSVSTQAITNDMVTIATVVSDGPGWLVIHAQAEGKPGPILGKSPVVSGENLNVTVEIDTAKATETLYAMLHSDAGEVGTFEFPDGPDVPVVVAEKVVTPAFTVSGLVMPEAEILPSVLVLDQELINDTVTVATVVSDGPGWLVIHAQAEGKPGPILGKTALSGGENTNVLVEIDAAKATETLYAMLHTDGGEVGTFEFPDGPDSPVMVDEKVVTPPFKVLAKEMPSESEALSSDGENMTVLLSGNDELGPFLTDADGLTLYIFAKDEPGVSNCYEQCAVNWPPLLVEDGQVLSGSDDLTAEFGITERTDGTTQVTYNGWPLYFFINDAAPGDTTGQSVGGVWAVAGLEPAIFSIVPGESQVAYEVGETFLGDNRFSVAMGVTSQVEGQIMGDLSNPRSVVLGSIIVDISQFKSDSDRRDNKIRSDFLQSTQFPLATFKPTEVEGIPGEYSAGEPVTLQITGELTVKEVTQSVTFEATVQLEGDILTGEASTTILMSDFGVGPISILGMLRTEDEVKLTFNFVARP